MSFLSESYAGRHTWNSSILYTCCCSETNTFFKIKLFSCESSIIRPFDGTKATLYNVAVLHCYTVTLLPVPCQHFYAKWINGFSTFVIFSEFIGWSKSKMVWIWCTFLRFIIIQKGCTANGYAQNGHHIFSHQYLLFCYQFNVRAISAIHLDRNGKRKTLSKTFLCFIMFRDYPEIVNHKVMHLIKNRFFFYRMNLFPCVLFFLIVTYF